MRRFLHTMVVRGVVLLALASVGYYLWNGITGSATDRWYGAAMVYMIIAVNLIAPTLLIATFSTIIATFRMPRAERLEWERRLFEQAGQPELAEGIDQSRAWTDPDDPMTHPLYRSTVGIPVRVERITDTGNAIRQHPLVRLGVRGGTAGAFEVVAVVPRVAVPRVGDVVRVVTHPHDPNRYRYAGPVDH